MSYAEFRAREGFRHEEILAHAHGRLVADPPEGFASRLPLPPMLMLDRVVEITRRGNGGRIVGERDVHLDDWFFQCHFLGDPVQPGCLGVDAVWQLIGFYCTWAGAIGAGRALGCGEVEFSGQIRPHDGVVRYEVDIRRFADLPARGAAIAIGDASVLVDGTPIYAIRGARVGIFRDISYADYPIASERSRGGRIEGVGR
ncbi:MAG: bifunctional 3-hydroxydecanoyl-ACP dehydratase/trans-2-decenoyl-ACP isomerase [Deltaproteobacteria bacterium]|nr:bifunctional 3-hydroxydecanoyl-ACP dehydratase/trans-2-decenoyl-ACP isomerase [Deltaproteobacteria bacterium]